MTFTSKAIVLRLGDFGEADRYVEFFSQKWGVISALAKSARKSKRRYVGGLDLFCHDEILLRGEPRERPYLVELTVLNSFTKLREDLEKMMVAGQVIQWVRKLAFHSQPMPEVYSLIGQTLSILENEDDPDRFELLGLLFRVKLLSHLGIKPRLDTCIRCEGTKIELSFFDIGAGGMVCGKCLSKGMPAEAFDLERNDRLFLSGSDRVRLSQWKELKFPSERVRPLSRLLTQFATYHSHVRLP